MFSILVLVAFYVVSEPCFAIELNISRSLQDTFSVNNCSSCAKFNQATCVQGRVCQCTTASPTFFIYKQRCDSPSGLIDDQDCLSWPHGKNHLPVIDLTSVFSLPFYGTTFSSCSVPLARTFEYLDRRQGKWMKHTLQGDGPVFAVRKAGSGRRMVLKIFGNNDLVSFAGRIIRVDLLCKESEGEAKSCLILKANGTISTSSVHPTQGSVPSIQHGDLTTLAATSEKIKINKAEETTTPRIHYVGSQSKPRFRSTTPSNITVITQAHINGAVSIDKTNKKADTVVVAIISVLGAIACVLIIAALFAWFVIKYYKRFRRPQEQGNTPQSIVVSNNQDVQSAIQMATVSTAGRLVEPEYSELPDVVESANRYRSCGLSGPTDISIPVDNQDDFFIIRNPLQYNTLPRGRKLTDPLPATPSDRSKTPDLRLSHRTTSTVDPNATKTAQFLSSEVRKNFHIPVFQDSTRRKRSFTDADAGDVFFENITAKGLVVDLADRAQEKPIDKSTHSIYEDLSETSKQSRLPVYEPLEKATLQPPDVRKTTLERINQVNLDADEHLVCSEENSVPEYHVLEPALPEYETHENSPTNDQVFIEKPEPDNQDNQGALCVGTIIKSPHSSPVSEHHVEEGQNQDKDQSCFNQGLELDVESTVDKKRDPDNKDNRGTFCVGANTKGPYSPPMSEHHVEEGSNQDKGRGCSNQGLELDVESPVDNKSAQVSGKIFKDNYKSIGLNKPKDGSSHGLTHGRGRTSEKIFLQPRAKSSEF